MKTLTIVTDTEKGRSFRAVSLGYVLWPVVTPCPGKDRPVYLAFATSTEEMHPFLANVRQGKLIEQGSRYSEKIECLKSMDYKVLQQKHTEGVIAQVFLSDYLSPDPGMVDPAGVKFLCMPATDTLVFDEAVAADLRGIYHVSDAPRTDWSQPVPMTEDELRRIVGLAPYFASMLNNRIYAPMVQESRFYGRVLARFLKEGLASFAGTAYSYRDDSFGVHRHISHQEVDLVGLTTVCCLASHEKIGEVLADEVLKYLSESGSEDLV